MRRGGGGLCEIFMIDLDLAMLLVNMNCLGVLGKKLAWVKGGIMVENVVLGGLPMGRGRWGRLV